MQAQVKAGENSREIEVAKKSFEHKTLEERAAEYNGNLGLDGEYDWRERVGREVWQF